MAEVPPPDGFIAAMRSFQMAMEQTAQRIAVATMKLREEFEVEPEVEPSWEVEREAFMRRLPGE